MTLTTEQMETITVDALMKGPPRVKGKEAAQFRKAIEAEAREAVKAGQQVEIPPEWDA